MSGNTVFGYCSRFVGIGSNWPHSFGQFLEIVEWNVRSGRTANSIAGSVRSMSRPVSVPRGLNGPFPLYSSIHSPMGRRAAITERFLRGSWIAARVIAQVNRPAVISAESAGALASALSTHRNDLQSFAWEAGGHGEVTRSAFRSRTQMPMVEFRACEYPLCALVSKADIFGLDYAHAKRKESPLGQLSGYRGGKKRRSQNHVIEYMSRVNA
jgi:hypothetical protein